MDKHFSGHDWSLRNTGQLLYILHLLEAPERYKDKHCSGNDWSLRNTGQFASVDHVLKFVFLVQTT